MPRCVFVARHPNKKQTVTRDDKYTIHKHGLLFNCIRACVGPDVNDFALSLMRADSLGILVPILRSPRSLFCCMLQQMDASRVAHCIHGNSSCTFPSSSMSGVYFYKYLYFEFIPNTVDTLSGGAPARPPYQPGGSGGGGIGARGFVNHCRCLST